MRGAWCVVKEKVYVTCARSAMVYGSELWAMNVQQNARLERAEMGWYVGCVMYLWGIKCREWSLGRMGIQRLMLWSGTGPETGWTCVIRKDGDDWVKKCMSYEVESVRGRPRTICGIRWWRGTWEIVDWGWMMRRSVRSEGNCCGAGASLPLHKRGKWP